MEENKELINRIAEDVSCYLIDAVKNSVEWALDGLEIEEDSFDYICRKIQKKSVLLLIKEFDPNAIIISSK